MIKYLLAAGIEAKHGKYSGYPLISQYITESRFIQITRSEPRNFAERCFVGVVRRLAANPNYRVGSLKLEWNILRDLRKYNFPLLHLLWLERDLGFLDKVTHFPNGLCGTCHCTPESIYRILKKQVSRLQDFDAIILMSECQRAPLVDIGLDSEKLHVIPHGVDSEYFCPNDKLHDGKQFHVLSVGNYRRNFSRLKAVCLKLRSYHKIKFRIVAPREFEAEFDDLDNVRFYSNISDAALLNLYQTSSCLLMTMDAATANNALVEGLASGLPVVGELVGGIPEYCGAEAGIIAEYGNSGELADAILYLAENPHERARMSEGARRRGQALDWRIIAEKTRSVYEEILACRMQSPEV